MAAHVLDMEPFKFRISYAKPNNILNAAKQIAKRHPNIRTTE